MTADVHAHSLPEELLSWLRSEGPAIGIELDEGQARIAGRVSTMPLRGELTDLRRRLEWMDRAGVEMQLISNWIDLTAYALPPDWGVVWARRVNEALAAEASRHPDRLRALATVPLQDPEAAAAELRYAAGELGMVGVEIGTTIEGADLVTFGIGAFWEEAARLRSIVLLHPIYPLSGLDLSAYFLHNSVGRPAETTIAISRLVFSGVFDRYPGLRVCVVHGGGALPFLAGRLQRAYEAVPNVAARDLETPPLDAVRSLYYDTVLNSPQALRFLIDLVEVDRVLLGSDYPFEMGDLDPVRTIRRIPGVTAEELAMITSGNARRLISEAEATVP